MPGIRGGYTGLLEFMARTEKERHKKKKKKAANT